MGELGLLARLRGRLVLNAIRSFPRQSVLKVVVVATAGLGFWLGVFLVSVSGFGFVERNLEEMAPMLMETLLSMFFLFLGAMLAFSNAIISFGGLYRSKETAFLLSCPLGEESVFGYRLVESLTFSSWAFLVLGLPLMLGYGVAAHAAKGALAPLGLSVFYELHPRWWGLVARSVERWAVSSWYFPLAVLAYFVPFVVIAASAGAVVALLLGAFMPDRVKRVLGAAVVAATVGALAVALWVHGAMASGAPFTGAWLRRVLERLDFARTPFLPSFWVSQGLVQCAQGELRETGYWFLLLLSTAGVCVVAWWELSRRLMRRSWSRCQSHMGRRPRGRRRWPLVRWAPPLRLLAGKDWRVFLRDPVQWSQCAILFGLMGFYVLNLRTFSYHRARPPWRELTALLNLASTSLVLATVATRFVFPLLSLEGRRFWVLGLAPVGRGTLLWSKFLFSFVGSLAVTLPLILVSDYMLGLPRGMLWHHAAATVCVCFGVSGLSVGLGAVYPNWREDNPWKIVSGFGGTLTLLLSVGFVAVAVGLTAVPYAVRLVPLGEVGLEVLHSLAATAGASLVAGLLPMACGLRALRRLEF